MAERVLSFRTNDDGKLPEGIRLYPSTQYEAVPRTRPAATHKVDADWLASTLEAALLGDIRTLRAGVDVYLTDEARRAASRLGGGNFLLAAASFMLFEYVARIFHGEDNALENFKAYAGRFLDFEPRYRQLSDLLWRVFRNGIVHGAWPQAMSRDGLEEERVRFGVGVEADDPHLSSDPRVDGPTFVVNAVQLAEDLERSMVAGFLPWLRAASPEILLRGAPRLLIVRKHDAAWTQYEKLSASTAGRAPG